MKFSMTGQEKGDLLMQVITWECFTVYTKMYAYKYTYVQI